MSTFLHQLLDEIRNYSKRRNKVEQSSEADESLLEDDSKDWEAKDEKSNSEF